MRSKVFAVMFADAVNGYNNDTLVEQLSAKEMHPPLPRTLGRIHKVGPLKELQYSIKYPLVVRDPNGGDLLLRSEDLANFKARTMHVGSWDPVRPKKPKT